MIGEFFQRVRLAEKRMSFLIAGFGYIKRKTNNIASQSGQPKQSFETGG